MGQLANIKRLEVSLYNKELKKQMDGYILYKPDNKVSHDILSNSLSAFNRSKFATISAADLKYDKVVKPSTNEPTGKIIVNSYSTGYKKEQETGKPVEKKYNISLTSIQFAYDRDGKEVRAELPIYRSKGGEISKTSKELLETITNAVKENLSFEIDTEWDDKNKRILVKEIKVTEPAIDKKPEMEKSEVKAPDTKPEIKDDVKPEIKDDVKPEIKDDVKPEIKDDIDF